MSGKGQGTISRREAGTTKQNPKRQIPAEMRSKRKK